MINTPTKGSGFTTRALLDLSHHIASSLERCDYVRCWKLDFSKAFDEAKLEILVKKAATKLLYVQK